MSLIKKNNELKPFYSSLLDEFFNTGMMPYQGTGERSGIPALNVKEDEKNLTLDVRVPGMSKENIKIEYKNGFLTISGESKEENEEGKGKYLRREFSSYSFQRTIELPEEKYNVAEAEASYKDGILEITMPKNEETEKLQKTIEVK